MLIVKCEALAVNGYFELKLAAVNVRRPSWTQFCIFVDASWRVFEPMGRVCLGAV